MVIVNCCGRQKFRAHNLAAVWGKCKFFWGGGFPLPQEIPGTNTGDGCREEAEVKLNGHCSSTYRDHNELQLLGARAAAALRVGASDVII